MPKQFFEYQSPDLGVDERLDAMANRAYLIQHALFVAPFTSDEPTPYPENPDATTSYPLGFEAAQLQFSFVTQARARCEQPHELDVPALGLEFATKAALRVSRLVGDVPVLPRIELKHLIKAHEDQAVIQNDLRQKNGQLPPLTIRDYPAQVASDSLILPLANRVTAVNPSLLIDPMPYSFGQYYRYSFKVLPREVILGESTT